MKPWEETWRVGDDAYGRDSRVLVEGTDHVITDFFSGREKDALKTSSAARPPNDYDRAQLAAAAPEMARLLLELEWISQETDEGALQPQCMICEVRHEWDWRSQSWTNTHAPDCRWAAVLRKAGVLPTP